MAFAKKNTEVGHLAITYSFVNLSYACKDLQSKFLITKILQHYLAKVSCVIAEKKENHTNEDYEQKSKANLCWPNQPKIGKLHNCSNGLHVQQLL